MKERDRLAALGEMSAGLAHEIRNPLGAIKASAQYLAEEPDPRAAGEFIDIIVEEVDRLDRVVSSFLDYARPASSNPTPIDVNVAVGRTAQLLLPECEAAGVGCSVDLDERISPVRIDAERLRQVLINLVQNAVQAMDGSGRVGIETRALPANRTHGASVEIRVSDTGPGVPQRVLRHLFVPFVTTKDRGVGLGLAVCQRLVAAAGGTIEVKSPAGAGTTFIVRLPAANDATRPPSPSEAAAQGLDGEASAASAPESPSGSDSAGGPSATREPTAMAPPVEDRASTSTTNR
jgi:signal transduction histidine kinase